MLVHVYDFNKEIQTIELNIEGQGIKQLPTPLPNKSLSRKPIPGQRTTVS